MKEVEVRSGGYEAEYGKSLGGTVNVVTRGGGNELHGAVFGFYDSASLGAADRHEPDRAAVSAPKLAVPRQLDAGLSLGGPLVRDRIWLFGAWDRSRVDQPYQAVDHLVYGPAGVENVYEGRTETTTTDLFALDLSWAPSPWHTFGLSVFGDPGTTRGPSFLYPTFGWTRAGPASATTTERATGGTDVSVRWSGLPGTVLLEARYGFHQERSRDRSDLAGLPVLEELRLDRIQLVPGSGPAGRELAEGPGLVDETYRRNAFAASGSLLLGDHELKAGLEAELENSQRARAWAGGGQVLRFLAPDGAFLFSQQRYIPRFPLDCTLRTDGSRGHFGPIEQTGCLAWDPVPYVRLDFRSRVFSAYLQDSWRPLAGLTVKAGLRYDFQELEDATGVVRLRASDQWAPRLSVAWDPGGKGRARVFASAGRYYQVIPQDIQGRATTGLYEVFSYSYSPTLDLENDPAIFPYAYVGGGMYFPPGLEAPYQDELSAGVELQVGRGLVAGVRGVYRALGRALEDRCDFHSPAAGILDLVPPAERMYTQCALVNPGVGAIGQLDDPANPDCFDDFPANLHPRPCETVHPRRIYRGVEVAVQGRPARDLFLSASYVYSRLTGNYEGLATTGSGNGTYQTNPDINVDFDYVSLLPNDSGRLLNDRTHQLKVSASYNPATGPGAGLVLQLASGQPLSLYGYLPNEYSGFLIPRGSYGELPSTYQVDLHLQYAFRVGAISVTPIVDVFNVTDVQRATMRNQIYDTKETLGQTKPPYTSPTNPLFGKDVSWQRPRLIRVGARVAF